MTEFENDGKRMREAFETAVKYLAVSPRSEKEVKEKLYSKGFHREEVEDAIEKAKGYRYIDDEAYVTIFLDYYGNKYGKKKLSYKLTSEKGINKSLVDNLIDDIISDDTEKEKAQKCATKYVSSKRLEKKDAGKVGAFMYQRGFDWSTINHVLNTLFDEFEIED